MTASNTPPALAAVAARAQAYQDAGAALRQACRDAVDAGGQKQAVAAAAGVSRPTLDAWLRRAAPSRAGPPTPP